MARLRDARTSEIVFEGTPLECVVLAGKMGGATVAPELKAGEEWKCPTELIYDDVGMGFDPDAVLAGAEESATGLEAAAADLAYDDDERERLAEHAEAAAAALDTDDSTVREASAAVDAARAAQDRALANGG